MPHLGGHILRWNMAASKDQRWGKHRASEGPDGKVHTRPMWAYVGLCESVYYARPEKAHARPEVAHARLEGTHSVFEGPFHTLRTIVSSEGPLLCQTVMSPFVGLTDKTRRICVL